MSLIKAILAIIVHSCLCTYFGLSFIEAVSEYSNGSTDAVTFITVAKDILSFNFPLVLPNYYFRSIIYVIIGITEYPPNNIELLLFNIVNSAIFYILISAILNIIGNNKNIKYIYYFSPGVIFLSATLRTEWPGFLFILAAVIFVNKCQYEKCASSITMLMASLFVRPSAPSAALLTIFFKKYLFNNADFKSFVKLYFIISIFFIIILYIVNKFLFNYFESPWYMYTEYPDIIRNSVNINNNVNLFRLPAKILISYLLDGFNTSYIHSLFINPEGFNNLAATLRVVLFIIILYKIIMNNFANKYYLLNYYLIFTIPNIATIGFYQTRYLIVQDIFLYSAVFSKKYKVSKKYS